MQKTYSTHPLMLKHGHTHPPLEKAIDYVEKIIREFLLVKELNRV